MATVVEGSFEWDPDKAAANVDKHDITFEEASSVFADENALESADALEPANLITIGFPRGRVCSWSCAQSAGSASESSARERQRNMNKRYTAAARRPTVKTEDVADVTAHPGRFAFAKRKGPPPRYTLRLLRDSVAVTQLELSERTGIAQSEVSKIERREDVLIATLRRYVEGLGGELELTAVIGGRSYLLDLSTDAKAR
jgi:uncharacterized DUF497 family protein